MVLSMMLTPFNDVDAMVAFAEKCDVITLENEFINSDVLHQVQEMSGTPIYPSPDSFSLIENKLIEKQTFENAGIPVTPYSLIKNVDDLRSFGNIMAGLICLNPQKADMTDMEMK